MSFIIKSLLETDVYKFFMWQIMRSRHPLAIADYQFFCRNTPEYPLSELESDLNKELDQLCLLRFQPNELSYLAEHTVLSPDFILFLSTFQFNRSLIHVSVDGDFLHIDASGLQIQVMGFEIPCLYIVSELYFRRFNAEAMMIESRKRLQAKIQLVKDYQPKLGHQFAFSDFGLRRRWSGAFQDEMVATFKAELPQYFKGTSNVYLAKKHDLDLSGSMGHEFLQSYQATSSQLIDFQKNALHDWLDEFKGARSIALTDTIGMDAFLVDFDYYLTLHYEGMKHDSDCPFKWGDKAIAHYQKWNIDSYNKTLIFSNELNLQIALNLHDRFSGVIKVHSGIGTNLSNDSGVPPLNIVMKIMSLNGLPVAKITDSPGKTLSGDTDYVARLATLFNHNQSGVTVDA